MDELIEDGICPACGGDLKHRNQGIYECEDCGVMIPLEDDED
jgi:ribosomal protein L37AE/L43A